MVWLRVFGKFLISVGMGVLIFVAWVLWGTGFYTGQKQEALAAEFDRRLAAIPKLEDPSRVPGFVKDFSPGPGAPVFRLRIPAIDLDHVVVEGVSSEQLRLGPGHYPSCRSGFPPPLCTEVDEVFPGEKGRVIVSGHRTTYGAPFWDLDKLGEGDEIITETEWGKFVYRVIQTDIVAASDLTIVEPAATLSKQIVLTTCHPKFSAAERLVVYGELEEA